MSKINGVSLWPGNMAAKLQATTPLPIDLLVEQARILMTETNRVLTAGVSAETYSTGNTHVQLWVSGADPEQKHVLLHVDYPVCVYPLQYWTKSEDRHHNVADKQSFLAGVRDSLQSEATLHLLSALYRLVVASPEREFAEAA